MDRWADVVLVIFEVDELGIGKEAEPVRGEGPGEEGPGLLMELLEQLFGLFGRIAQAQGLEGAPGGGKVAGPPGGGFGADPGRPRAGGVGVWARGRGKSPGGCGAASG